MLLRQIKYFVKVLECNSFTEAAEQCYISQSAISQQINALEKELGVKLLQREGRKFSPTVSGEYFYNYGKQIIEEADNLKWETIKIDKSLREHICIGCPNDFTMTEVYKAVAGFNEKYPDISLEIISGSHDELYDLLKSGRVDIAINDQRREDIRNAYACIPLTAGKCFIEVARRNPLAALPTVDESNLRRLTCIIPARDKYREQESSFYQNILGLDNQFVFADDVDKARLMVIVDKGFMLTDNLLGAGKVTEPFLHRIPFMQNGRQIECTYYAFWKKENRNAAYIANLAERLQQLFG